MRKNSPGSMDLEDLLLSTFDAVSRFRVGQREAVGADPAACHHRASRDTGVSGLLRCPGQRTRRILGASPIPKLYPWALQ